MYFRVNSVSIIFEVKQTFSPTKKASTLFSSFFLIFFSIKHAKVCPPALRFSPAPSAAASPAAAAAGKWCVVSAASVVVDDDDDLVVVVLLLLLRW